MNDKKQLLFRVTKKDLDIKFFRTGGPGGQKQNKTSSGCRIVHRDSGAVGECRNHRSQEQNKQEAFRRMAASDKFQQWVKIKSAGKSKALDDLDKKVDNMLRPENLKIDYGEDALK